MHTLEPSYEPQVFGQAVAAANRSARPLFIVVLATKPCYIKLASLALALRRGGVPFLLADTGQHYEPVLTGASEEFDYRHLIGVHLHIRGSLLGRTADLALKLQWLASELRAAGLREPPVPVVSGDTSTAALLPAFWYLETGYRSVHVEAGLRSMGPGAEWRWRGVESLLSQRRSRWERFRDEPFPEGIDTTLASVASDLLLAPVQRNADNLIREGYSSDKIRVVGSLSFDAVKLALDAGAERVSPPDLSPGRWLRVDIHRRENTTPTKLRALIGGLAAYSGAGGRVVLIMTNAFRSAVERHGMGDLLDAARARGVVVQDLWSSYLDVIHFMRSPACLGIYTDSGGLQEEASVLGTPCVTCRYSTDRPETVLEGASNVLLPPASEELVARGLDELFGSDRRQVWPGLGGVNLYGEDVGEHIAEILSGYTPPPPASGADALF